MYYQINNFRKFSEEDNWEEGCILNTGQSQDVSAYFRGETATDVIQQAAKFLGVETDDIEYNVYNEPGRVDFVTLEDKNGHSLTQSEFEQFKRGKFRAWYAIYSAFVETVTRVAISRPEQGKG